MGLNQLLVKLAIPLQILVFPIRAGHFENIYAKIKIFPGALFFYDVIIKTTLLGTCLFDWTFNISGIYGQNFMKFDKNVDNVWGK